MKRCSSLTSTSVAIIKNEKKTNVGEDMEKLEYLLIWMHNCAAASSSKRLNTELPYEPTIPLLGIYLKEMQAGTQTNTPKPIFTAGFSTIAKKWKQPKCPLTDEQINKIKYGISIERNIISHKMKQSTDPCHVVLSEINQTWKTNKWFQSSCCGAVETNPTGIHEVAGLIPGLAQWVRDLAFLWAVV